MTVEQKLDMVIEMVAHMNEQMTMQFGEMHEKFAQIDERFEQIDKRFEQIDARFDRMDERFDRMDKRMDHFEEKMETYRAENAKEHQMFNQQLNSIMITMNHSMLQNNDRYEELKAKDAELERVQREQSADIMALRAAI